MGEKLDFSKVSTAANSPEPFNRELAIAELSSVSVSTGFYLTAFSLISFFATILAGIILYFSITEIVRTSEITFKRYAADMLTASENQVQTAVKTYKFANLNMFMKSLVDRQGIDEENKMINEMFYLDKKGKVLAHTDLTKTTSNANALINRISGIYNNELFHTGLMLSPGEMNVQPYPYQTYNRDRSYLYLFKYLLPRDYFDAMDYSIPVYNGRYAAGTFHLVMNRIYTDLLLKKFIGELFLIWAVSIFVALLIALFIKLPVQSRMKKLNLFVQNYLAKDVEHYIQKVEKLKIREEMEYIDHKIAEMVKNDSSSHTAQNRANVKDAYLLREN
ncbi:MAG: hypothetical protein OEV66_06740 [Spirochaetia bacterium]|nr:hypothetical protein [Spirochaetia bacterium]